MRWWLVGALGLIGGALALVGGLYGYGATLPVEHVATVEATVSAPPDLVFDLVADPVRGPEWRSDVQRVQFLGKGQWLEVGDERMVIEVQESVRPTRYVAAVVGHEDFGGTWTWELSPADGGTRVRITEAGEVYSPLFRGVMTAFGLQTATMEARIDDLRAALSE